MKEFRLYVFVECFKFNSQPCKGLTVRKYINIAAQFNIIKKGNTLIVIKNKYKDKLLKQGIETPHKMCLDSTSTEFFKGREKIPSLLIEGTDNEKMVIKHYTRGGFARKLSKDIFWGKLRPIRELKVLEEAKLRKVQTAEILAVIIHKMPGFFYKAYLVSKAIPGGIDLKTYIERLNQTSTNTGLKEKRQAIISVARAVRNMHDKGIYHADLNMKNIVIQKQTPILPVSYIIDFDKSTIAEHLSLKNKFKNLFRLHRSADKLIKNGIKITKTDQYRFFKEYLNNDIKLKLNIHVFQKGYARHKRVHTLGKKLLSMFNLNNKNKHAFLVSTYATSIYEMINMASM